MSAELKLETDFLRPRLAERIPWGWRTCIDNPEYLEPVMEQLELLDIAREHLETCSQREVASWLSRASGRPISQRGLMLVLDRGF